MEMRHEQQPRQHAAPRKQTTMQANQAKINQEIAVALEKLNGRMENMEQWREDRDRERERATEHRDYRDDKRRELTRADIAIIFSALSAAVYVLTFLAQHWR